MSCAWMLLSAYQGLILCFSYCCRSSALCVRMNNVTMTIPAAREVRPGELKTACPPQLRMCYNTCGMYVISARWLSAATLLPLALTNTIYTTLVL